MSMSIEKQKMRVLLVRMFAGAVIGAAVTAVFLATAGKPLGALDDLNAMLATVAGLSYVTIGVIVWAGMVAPSLGARFLNVEDADELREETPKLKSAVVVMVLTGAFLLILAFSAAAMLPRDLALALAGLCVVGIAIAGWLGAKRSDEMGRKLGNEVASATFQITMLFVAVWGALAELDYVDWLAPLALLSAVALVQLFASFVIIGKRGMLMPR